MTASEAESVSVDVRLGEQHSPVDFAAFAVDQFRAPLRPDSSPRSGVDLVVSLEGDVAKALGKEVLELHRKQRYPFWCTEIDPVPFEPTIVRVAVISLKGKEAKKLPRKFTRDNKYFYTIPIVVNDTGYVLEDTEGRIYMLTDHTNSVAPSHTMYREMSKRKKMDRDSTIFSILQTYSHSAEYRGGKDRESFVRYIESHSRVAAAHGITINVRQFAQYFDEGRFSEKSPMHCYLSGVHATDTYGHLSPDGQFVLKSAIRRMRQEYPGVLTEDKLTSYIVAQCETVEGVFNLLRYDVLPTSQDALTLKTELASYLVNDYLHPETRIKEDGKRSLAQLTDSQLASYILHLSSQFTNASEGHLFLMSIDNTYFHQMQLVGLLENAPLMGFESYAQICELMQHVPMKRSEKKRFQRDLSLAMESIELKEMPHSEHHSYEVSSWLGIGEQIEFVGETQTRKRLIDNSFALSSGNLFGQIQSQWRPRLQIPSNVESWTMPWVSGLAKKDRDESYPLWSAWIEKGVEMNEYSSDPLDILSAIVHVRQFLHNPFWRLQTDSRQNEITDHFFHWLKTTITDHVAVSAINRLEMDLSVRKKLAGEIHRLIERSRFLSDGLPYGQLGNAIEKTVKSVQFALQMEQVYRDMHALEYFAVPAKPPSLNVHIGLNYIPYHLAAMQTKAYQRVKSRIEYGLHEVRGNEERHLGVRVRELANNPDMLIKCWGFIVPIHQTKSVETEWNFRKQSRQIILDWVRESAVLITDDQWNIAENEYVGGKFFSWIRHEIGKEWKEYKEAHDHEEKLTHLKHAIALAGALQDINKAHITNFSSGGLDQAGYLEKYLTEALELHTLHRIVPFGELSLSPNNPIILRAENMTGKSSIMRGILYAAQLQNQGLPQLGDIEIPFGLHVDTPIGAESQGVDRSLITSAITGLHRIAGIEKGAATTYGHLWAIDEMGRRTNKHFGETLYTTSLLLSSLVKRRTNIVVSACHYHDVDRLTPLFTALGIHPQWFTVSQGHTLRQMSLGERTKSLAIASLLPFLGAQALVLWPDNGDKKVLNIPSNPEVYKPHDALSCGRVEEISYADLFGVSKEQRYDAISAIIGVSDPRMTGSFEKLFLKNIDGGQKAQTLFEAIDDHDVVAYKNIFKTVLAVMDFYNPPNRSFSREDFHDRQREVFTRLGLVYDHEHKLSDKAWKRKANAALRRLNASYRCAIREYNNCLKESGFTEFSPKGMMKRIDFSSLQNPGHTFQDQVAFTLSTLSFVQKFSGKTNTYNKVHYTDDPVVDMKNVYNPFLRSRHIVPNDVYIDFSDETAGMFISGENFSGKSNYLRTIGIAIWLARTTGFAPASEIVMNKRVLPLSLTQPVSDEIGASSMAVEARDRLTPVFQASQGVYGSYIVSLLDEPAAPTSPEDASKTNIWLYRNYMGSRGRAKLFVSSHSNDVPQLLAQESIPVELAAFQLLSQTEKFKKIHGTVDSNALEVARELGLNENIYHFAVCVHEYIKAVDSGDVREGTVRRHAVKLQELLKRIENRV